MTNEILQEPNRTLPVLSVAGRSYSYVWDQRALLIAPLVVVFLIEYGVAVAGQLAGAHQPLSGLISLLAVSLVGIVGLMAFAVGLHRTILLRDIHHGVSFLRWDANLRRYSWAWIKIFLLTVLGASLVVVVVEIALIKEATAGQITAWKMAGIGIGSMLAIGIIILPRSVLALPAAALGEDGSLRQAWRTTRGNGLRMIAVLLLAILPFTLLGLLLELPTMAAAAMAKMLPNVAGALDSLKYLLLAFSAALRAISTAVLTVTLSLSYAALARPAGFQE